MFYLSQNQLDELSNIILDLSVNHYPPSEAATIGLEAQSILIDVEQSQPCQAANLLNSITHLRSTANYAQFGAAMYPHTNGRYVLEKFHTFQDDPLRYFTQLDTANRQRFVNWMLTSQPQGAVT